MILKVRAVGKETYDWLILCGVRDIVYSGNPLTDCPGLQEDDYVLLNLPTDEGKTDVETCVQEKKTPKWKKMEIRYKDGNRCSVYFNDVAYLMNDEGKTVETIYGF